MVLPRPPLAPPLGPAPMPTPMPAPMPMMNPQPAMMGMPPALPAPPMASPLAMLGGGPVPMPMQQAGIDPNQMLADPLILMMVLQLMAQDDEMQNGPVYDWWYKPNDYPKPTATAVQQKAWQDQDDYHLLIRRMASDRKIILMLDVGRFHDFDPEVEHTFADSALAHDFMLQVNLVAGCDLNFDAKARILAEEALAEKKELFCHSVRDHAERRHNLMYGTDLAYDEVKYLAGTGHVVWRVVYDLQARSDECPIKIDLLDPATCYPTWDGDRGLKTMTRVYSERVDTIVSTWETKKNKVKDTLLGTTIKTRDGAEKMVGLNDQVEVIEFWNRRHNIVVANGVEVFHWEHKYGFVPFVYNRTPFGDAGPTNLNALYGYKGASGSSVRQAELASKGLSVIWASKLTHSQREALLGVMMTEINKVRNPPQHIAQDMSIYGDAPDISDAPGSINMYRKGLEERAPGPEKPGMSLIPAVMGAVNEANMRGLMPAAASGITSNANESGTAIEGLNEAGRDKLSPLLKTLTRGHTQVAEMSLRLVRDWGHLMGSEGEKGTLYVPRLQPKPDEDGYVTLTPKELKQVGCQIRVKMTSLRLANLGNLGNAIGVWKNLGLMEDAEALEMRGVRDPQATLRRIKIQELKNSDDYKRIDIMKLLREEKDFEGIAIFQQMLNKEMMAAMNGGGPGGPPSSGPPPPGMPPTAPGGPNTQGGNIPGLTQGPQGAARVGGAMGLPSRAMGPRTDAGPPIPIG